MSPVTLHNTIPFSSLNEKEDSLLQYTTLNQTQKNLYTRSTKFLKTLSKMKKYKNVMGSLLELSHADCEISIQMWTQIFPKLWNTLNQHNQTKLVDPLNRLLSQTYHRYQLQLQGGHGYRRNVIQTLLSSFSTFETQPYISSELLIYLGKTYNAWHVVINILEKKLFHLNKNNTPEEIHSITNGLKEMYSGIGEMSCRNGIRRMTATTSGKYLSEGAAREGAAREWSTVVSIFITFLSFKPISLSLSRFPLI